MSETVSMDFGNERENLHSALHRMSEFIAMFEAAEEKMVAREHALQESMQANEHVINAQLEKIQKTLNEFTNIMTEAGAARWRVAAEGAMRDGKAHIESLTKANEEFFSNANKSCERLDRASNFAIKGVSEAVNAFSANDFKRLTGDCLEQVRRATDNAVSRIGRVVKWFHWKNIALALSITVVVMMVTGLYLNDEYPWEIHQEVIQQRDAGQALINAWPSLSAREKTLILNSAKKSFV